jgi:hypothetical protein
LTPPPAPFQFTALKRSKDGLDLTLESDHTRLDTIETSTTLLPDSGIEVQSFIPGATGVNEATVPGLLLDPGTSRGVFRVRTSDGF